VLTGDGWIRPEHLPGEIIRPEGRLGLSVGGEPMTLAEMEREHILKVLKSAGGNRSKAAEILGIGKTTLWRKLKEAGEIS
jgi:transcriptional regulator with PAS, ATPase and Fis domain